MNTPTIAAGQEQHQPEVRARPVAAGPHPVRGRGRHHDHRQPDEPDREALEHADVVRGAEVLEPRQLRRLLQPAPGEVVANERLDPEADLEQRDQQRERREPDARHRQQPDEQRAAERDEDQRGRDPAVGVHRTATKTTIRTATPAPSASTYIRTRPVCRSRVSDPAHRASDVTPRIEPLDQRSLDDPVEQLRERDRRPVEEPGVELVEPELPLEQRPRPRRLAPGAPSRSTTRRRSRRVRARPRRCSRPPPGCPTPRRAAARPARASCRSPSTRRRTGSSRRSPRAPSARRPRGTSTTVRRRRRARAAGVPARTRTARRRRR